MWRFWALAETTGGVIFLGGHSPLVPLFGHDDAFSTASVSLYMTSSSFLKLTVLKIRKKGWYFSIILPSIVSLTLYCSQLPHKSLLSKIAHQSPGEWMLKWRHVISVPYQWLTEACVPWAVTSLSLSLAGPVGSTMPRRLDVVNTSSEKSSPEKFHKRKHL